MPPYSGELGVTKNQAGHRADQGQKKENQALFVPDQNLEEDYKRKEREWKRMDHAAS